MLGPLSLWIRETHGQDTLSQVAREAGLDPSDFDGCTRWIMLEECEAFLAAARRLMTSDAEFRAACAHNYARMGYGPLRLLMLATSAWNGFVQGGKHMHLVTRISRFEHRREGKRCIIRYSSERRESELMCLSRQGQIVLVPTLWGLPPLELDHPRCIARGDDCCEYHFYLLENRRWLPGFLGLVGGSLGAGALALAGHGGFWPWAAVPVVGLLLGHTFELLRTARANLEVGRAAQAGLKQMADEEAEARRELLAFHQRQREWTRLVEDQVTERTAALQKLIADMKDLEARRVRTLKGFSHDLKNPLSVLRLSTDLLREHPQPTEETPVMLEEMAAASDQMNRLLGNLVAALGPESERITAAKPLPVAPIAERLRRRLAALVFGRGIRVSAFTAREAPETVLVDELVFDRVVDNLLSNAAKYTARGSILVEVGGTPGFLTLKFSDTGRGIAEADLERIFRAGASDERTRAPGSSGIGLSIVVQLLEQLGGRLEVMSKLGVGTTFWVHVPVTPVPKTATPPPPTVRDRRPSDSVAKVVVLRRTAE